MVQLQTPKYLYMAGKIRPWEEGVIHVGAEGVVRGLNVFEGVKGYWQQDGNFRIVLLEKHYRRLTQSARLLHVPCPCSYEEYRDATCALIASMVERGRDMWARTTLLVTEGYWGIGTKADLVITAYHQDQKIPDPIDLGVSTWQRPADAALPARIKTSTNYQAGRLARIEGRALGCQEMVLLNPAGRVAEASGACVLVVRDGVIYTPTAAEGALESITLDAVEALARSFGIPFVRRPVDRTELEIADEMALCGTLCEVALIRSFERQALPENPPILGKLQAAYFDAVRGVKPHPFFQMTTVHPGAAEAERARRSA
jgi:branched-chain amino acid aminotransferase